MVPLVAVEAQIPMLIDLVEPLVPIPEEEEEVVLTIIQTIKVVMEVQV
jgi:hypothetical protein